MSLKPEYLPESQVDSSVRRPALHDPRWQSCSVAEPQLCAYPVWSKREKALLRPGEEELCLTFEPAPMWLKWSAGVSWLSAAVLDKPIQCATTPPVGPCYAFRNDSTQGWVYFSGFHVLGPVWTHWIPVAETPYTTRLARHPCPTEKPATGLWRLLGKNEIIQADDGWCFNRHGTPSVNQDEVWVTTPVDEDLGKCVDRVCRDKPGSGPVIYFYRRRVGKPALQTAGVRSTDAVDAVTLAAHVAKWFGSSTTNPPKTEVDVGPGYFLLGSCQVIQKGDQINRFVDGQLVLGTRWLNCSCTVGGTVRDEERQSGNGRYVFRRPVSKPAPVPATCSSTTNPPWPMQNLTYVGTAIPPAPKKQEYRLLGAQDTIQAGDEVSLPPDLFSTDRVWAPCVLSVGCKAGASRINGLQHRRKVEATPSFVIEKYRVAATPAANDYAKAQDNEYGFDGNVPLGYRRLAEGELTEEGDLFFAAQTWNRRPAGTPLRKGWAPTIRRIAKSAKPYGGEHVDIPVGFRELNPGEIMQTFDRFFGGLGWRNRDSFFDAGKPYEPGAVHNPTIRACPDPRTPAASAAPAPVAPAPVKAVSAQAVRPMRNKYSNKPVYLPLGYRELNKGEKILGTDLARIDNGGWGLRSDSSFIGADLEYRDGSIPTIRRIDKTATRPFESVFDIPAGYRELESGETILGTDLVQSKDRPSRGWHSRAQFGGGAREAYDLRVHCPTIRACPDPRAVTIPNTDSATISAAPAEIGKCTGWSVPRDSDLTWHVVPVVSLPDTRARIAAEVAAETKLELEWRTKSVAEVCAVNQNVAAYCKQLEDSRDQQSRQLFNAHVKGVVRLAEIEKLKTTAAENAHQLENDRQLLAEKDSTIRTLRLRVRDVSDRLRGIA